MPFAVAAHHGDPVRVRVGEAVVEMCYLWELATGVHVRSWLQVSLLTPHHWSVTLTCPVLLQRADVCWTIKRKQRPTVQSTIYEGKDRVWEVFGTACDYLTATIASFVHQFHHLLHWWGSLLIPLILHLLYTQPLGNGCTGWLWCWHHESHFHRGNETDKNWDTSLYEVAVGLGSQRFSIQQPPYPTWSHYDDHNTSWLLTMSAMLRWCWKSAVSMARVILCLWAVRWYSSVFVHMNSHASLFEDKS